MFIWVGLKDYENFSLKKNCIGGWNVFLENFWILKNFIEERFGLNVVKGNLCFI